MRRRLPDREQRFSTFESSGRPRNRHRRFSPAGGLRPARWCDSCLDSARVALLRRAVPDVTAPRRFTLNEGSQSADQVQHGEPIQHTRFHTGLSYDALVHAFERELGRLDPALPRTLVERKAAWDEVQREIGAAARPHGLMIIAHFDQGRLTSLSGPGSVGVGGEMFDAHLRPAGRRARRHLPHDRPVADLAGLGRCERQEPHGDLCHPRTRRPLLWSGADSGALPAGTGRRDGRGRAGDARAACLGIDRPLAQAVSWPDSRAPAGGRAARRRSSDVRGVRARRRQCGTHRHGAVHEPARSVHRVDRGRGRRLQRYSSVPCRD